MAQPLSSFTLFGALPTELRGKIWRLCLPGPRIVEVFIKGHLLPRERDKNLDTDLLSSSEPTSLVCEYSFEPRAPDSDDPSPELPAPIYISSSPLPTPLLHTCHESRELAEKYYVLSFGTPSSPPRTYFNVALDTLYLPFWSFEHGSSGFAAWTALAPSGAPVVQHIAFDLDKWYSCWLDGYLNYQIEPLKWPRLKSITFLLYNPHSGGLCSCCVDPERPQVLGGVGFAELQLERSNYAENVLGDCAKALQEMVEEHPGFEAPVVRVMELMRNGVKV